MDRNKIDNIREQLEEKQIELLKLTAKTSLLKREIDDLTDSLASATSSIPFDNDQYTHIGWGGEICCRKWESTQEDFGAMAIGNVFKTKEEAEAAKTKLETVSRLKRLADNYNDGPAVFSLVPRRFKGTVFIEVTSSSCFTMLPRFSTKSLAEQAIKEVDQDKILALFH